MPQLKNYQELPEERLETLGNFCVDLSRTFAGYQMDFFHRRRLAV